MKRILSFCMLLLLQLAAHAQDTQYTVTLTSQPDGKLSPYAYGSYQDDRRTQFAPGEEVHLAGSLRSEYSFVSWTDESGQVVCDSLRYTFTMPAHDVAFVGHCTYDPENPPGPREDGYTDTWQRLYLRSLPEFGGTFSWGAGAENAQNWLVWAGYEFTVTAYPATGFKFVGFQVDGETVSTENPYTFIMPERDMTLYAVYEYAPDAPPHPNSNKWDKESGELIMSDFTPGKLYSQISEVTRRDPWNSDWDLIKSAIVSGPALQEGDGWATASDWTAFNNCNNVEYLDFSRTSGLTYIPSYCFSNLEKLNHIVIPATTDSIAPYAFRNCKALTTITCFSTTPPVLGGLMPGEQGYEDANNYGGRWPFDGLDLENIIVYVPAEAVPLYQQAHGWKELLIQPIAQGISRLSVSLPQAQTYKDMFLELQNTKTLQTVRYVITGTTSYTFNNLIHGTSYNLYVKNQRGAVMGRMENIGIVDSDVSVSLANLATPRDLTLLLTDPSGVPLDDYAVTWTDRQGNFIATGTTLKAQAEGSEVYFHVKPGESIGRRYITPADSLITVGQGSALSISLKPLPRAELSGTVTAAATGQPIRSATVTVSQMLNGLYTESQTVRTDANGRWAMTVYEASTTVTVMHSDYLKDMQSLSAEAMINAQVINSQLKDLNGTIVDLDLYYRAAVHDGEESISEDFTDWANVAYSVYDATHQAELTDISLQYPILVLANQELAEGTLLRVTATSLNKAFMPVVAECRVDSSGRAMATLPLIEMGKIEASFETTENRSVIAILFDGQGRLVGWSPYNGTNLTVSSLPDDRYTLITLGQQGTFFTSFGSLDAFEQVGMNEGTDYVKNEINVSSGHIVRVFNTVVPTFYEDDYRFTGSNTSLAVNKSEVSVGQYVTLSTTIDFKDYILPAIQSTQLIYELPEGCELMEQSVMIGSGMASYVQQDGRITIEVDKVRQGETVRFCVVPTTGGIHQVTASIRVVTPGNPLGGSQPIGSAVFTAEDLSITVPATTARRLLPVTGMAVPLSMVDIYDNDVLVGHTTSLGTGYWNAMCQLDRPYNLSEHTIYAVVTTPEGLQMQSESKTVTINRSGLTPVVTMQLKGTTWEHHQRNFVFDFRTNQVSPAGMKLTDFGDFTLDFRVDFYDDNDMLVNDTAVIRDVVLYTLGERGNIETYALNYNPRYKCWYKFTDKNASNMPVNVDVDYSLIDDVAFDRQEFEDQMQDLMSYAEESRQHMLETYHMYDDISDELENQTVFNQLESLLNSETLDDADLDRLETLVTQLVGTEVMAEADAQYAIDFSEIDALQAKDDLTDAELEHLEELIEARLDEVLAIQTDSVGNQQLSQLFAELESSYKTLTEETRDSLMCLSTFFYLPDTVAVTLPNGDVSMLLVGETRSAQLDIKNLDSIDREQLLAEGYTEVPTTDGNYFYYLATGGEYKVIDAVQKKLYSKVFLDDDVAAVRHKEVFWGTYLGGLSLSAFLPKECFSKFDNISRHIAKTAEQLRQSTDAPSLLINALTNLIPIIVDIEEIMECLYDIGRNNLDIHIQNAYNNGMKKYESALKTFQKQYQKATKAVAIEKTKLKRLRNMQQKLEHQIRYYNSRLNRAEQATDIYKWNSKLISARDKLQVAKTTFDSATRNLKNLQPAIKTTQRFLTKAEKALANFKSFSDGLLKLFSMLPIKLIPDNKILKKIPWSVMQMPVIGPIVKLFPALMVTIDNVQDMQAWDKTHKAVKAVMPCEGEPEKAQQLLNDCEFQYGFHGVTDVLHIGVDLTAWIVDVFKVAPSNFVLAKALDVASCIIGTFHPGASQKAREGIERRLKELDCDKDPEPEPDTNDPNGDWIPSGGTLGGADLSVNHSHSRPVWNFLRLWFVRDPAGYVYEAVSSNRLEGVQTTCYYKETREDMYGDLHDEAVLWDAENYAQENPLFTDSEGRYQWDVPTGLWQVKYEKAGYETTYSDWLPVPPPQLEVNVGMTQLRQPQVAKVKAYTDGIEITFDKYMRPLSISPEGEGTEANIIVTKDGQIVPGTIELLNAESGYETPDSVYASKLRFNVNANLDLNDKVQLTVRKRVESYAGLQMEQDFTQQFDVEQRIEALLTDSLVNITEDKQLTLTVKAIPAAAAKGRTVTVNTSDAEVATLTDYGTAAQLTLDQDGQAQLDISSLRQGTSIIRFAMTDDDNLRATTLINVRDSASMVVSRPTSSWLNGITLYQGTEIVLSCATAGATIIYTLNGTCPCDPASGNVLTYDGPIILTGPELTIRAMAIAPGMEDSPVVEFTYKGKDRPSGVEAPTVPDGIAIGSEPMLFFRLNGQRISQPEQGVTIVRHRDGTVRKVVMK